MAPSIYTKSELSKKTTPELKGLLSDHDLELEEETRSNLIHALLEVEEDDELDDDELDDELDDEELDDDEVDDIEEAPKKKSKAATKPAKAKKSDADGETLAAKQVATMLGTEAKTLRQFLRSDASTFEAVGSGGRYEFTQGDVQNIKKEFEAWRSAHAARGSKRGPGKKSSTPANVEEIEEIEEIEELEIEELDDELDDEDLELED